MKLITKTIEVKIPDRVLIAAFKKEYVNNSLSMIGYIVLWETFNEQIRD